MAETDGTHGYIEKFEKQHPTTGVMHGYVWDHFQIRDDIYAKLKETVAAGPYKGDQIINDALAVYLGLSRVLEPIRPRTSYVTEDDGRC